MWHGYLWDALTLSDRTEALATELRLEGIAEGDRVVLACGDSARSVLTLLALMSLGVTIVVVDPERAESAACDGGLPIVDPEIMSTATARIHLRERIDEIAGQPSRSVDRIAPLDLSAWFARPDALCLLTSGSTGARKTVTKHGAQLREDAEATITHLGITALDRLLALLPLSHQYGLSVLLIAVVSGASVVVCDRRRTGEAVRTISRHSVTAVDAAPRSYQAILSYLDAHPNDLHRLQTVRLWGVGGEPLDPMLDHRFERVVGRHLIDGYGSTEHGNIALADPRTRGEGLIPLPLYEVRTRAQETGADSADSGVLEVRRHSPRTGEPVSEWMATGDLGTIRNGRVSVLGRDGALHRNGYTIIPSGLEGRLRADGIRSEIVASASGEGRFWLVVEDPLFRSRAWWRSRIEEVIERHEMPNHIEVLRRFPLIRGIKKDRRAIGSLVAGLESGRSIDTLPGGTLGRLIALARERADEIIALCASHFDERTAVEDYKRFLSTLEDAVGELAVYRPAAAPEVFVSLPSNALLESLALYALVSAQWSRQVTVRAASGTEAVIAGVVDVLADALGGRVAVIAGAHEEFISLVAAQPSVYIFCGHRRNLDRIVQRLSPHHMVFFFGRGFNPAVVNSAADVGVAASALVADRMFNGGQDCLAPHMIYVHDAIWEQFRAAVCSELDAAARHPSHRGCPARTGSLHDALTHIVTHRQRVTRGGTLDGKSGTVEPTIIELTFRDAGEPREMFAPIFTLVRFDDFGNVRELLRNDRFEENALALTLWGVSEGDALPFTESHQVAFERSVFDSCASFEAFGGTGAEAGSLLYKGKRLPGPLLISRDVSKHWHTAEREGIHG